MNNRVAIIEALLAAGLESKDAVASSKEHMKDKALFFAKLKKAQQNLGRIIKDTKDQRGKNYAGVDQFVGKAQRAFNEAGLTMFESQTGVVTKSENVRSWMIDAIIGDATTGFSMPIHYEVPINSQAFSKEPEKAVGAADSYGLKYMTRSILFAERSEHDPDRRDDPDDAGYEPKASPKKAPKKKSAPSVAPAKKKAPKKVTAEQRKKAARERLMVARSSLGSPVYNKVMESNSMDNLDQMEAVANVLETRMRLAELKKRSEKAFGKDQVEGWLELFRPFVTQENIDDGIACLVAELNNNKGEEK